MIFPEKEIILKDGRTATLRSPLTSDAETALKFLKQTAGETPFLLRTPEECTMTIEEEERFLSRFSSDPDSVMIQCFVDGVLAGNCQIDRKRKLRNRHRAGIGIAVKREFWNLGIGTALIREMIAIAEGWGLLQVELEVIEGNERGMTLYRKMGFEAVSHVPNAIRMNDGSYVKEFFMVRSLGK